MTDLASNFYCCTQGMNYPVIYRSVGNTLFLTLVLGGYLLTRVQFICRAMYSRRNHDLRKFEFVQISLALLRNYSGP